MKQTIRIFALLLALFTMLSVCACGGDKPSESGETKASDTAGKEAEGEKSTSGETNPPETAAPVVQRETKMPGVLAPLKAEAVGRIPGAYEVSSANGCWYYRNSDWKYGVISADGKTDTGAKYADAYPVNENWAIFTEKEIPDQINEASEANCIGLIRLDGSKSLPAVYAGFNAVNDCFILGIRLLEKVDPDYEGYVVGIRGNQTVSYLVLADVCFSAEMDIISLEEGKVLRTYDYEPDRIHEYGMIVMISDADGNEHYYNVKGDEIKECDMVYENGTYGVIRNDKTQVLDSDGNLLFTYRNLDYVILSWDADCGCYYAKNSESDNFLLLDGKGNRLTEELSNDWHYEATNGTLLLCSYYDADYNSVYYICDRTGKKVIEDEFDHGCYNGFEDAFFLSDKEGRFVVLTGDGKLAADVKLDEEVRAEYCTGALPKNQDSKEIYCYDAADFTLRCDTFSGPFFIVDGNRSVIDTVTGKVLLKDCHPYSDFIEGDVQYVLGTDAIGDFIVYKITADK